MSVSKAQQLTYSCKKIDCHYKQLNIVKSGAVTFLFVFYFWTLSLPEVSPLYNQSFKNKMKCLQPINGHTSIHVLYWRI